MTFIESILFRIALNKLKITLDNATKITVFIRKQRFKSKKAYSDTNRTFSVTFIETYSNSFVAL